MPSTLELVSVLFNLIYLILLIRRNIWCWGFGLIGSILGIKVMYDFGLRIEPWLYLFYAAVAIYGFIHWKQEGSENENYQVKEWPWKTHALWILVGFIGTYFFGWLFDKFSEGEKTYLDAFTSSFAIIATFLQLYKVKSNFIYWIIVNAATVYLYFSQKMTFYPWLMIVYTVVSVYGWIKWVNLKD